MRTESAAYDLIVVGAGINGAAIARAAALDGHSVLLLERADIGGGTTSASTRLIHGGLRYLEHGELGLVRESLREREALLELAPHLVEPLGLYLPLYRRSRRRRWQVRIGLQLYDLLALGNPLPAHRMLSRAALLERLPYLSAEGLVGGAFYFDAQIRFPERLVVENVLDASRHGASVMNHTGAEAIRVTDGAVKGVAWLRSDGTRGHAAAPIVINAAGPWIDQVVDSVAVGHGAVAAHVERAIGIGKGAIDSGNRDPARVRGRLPLIGGTKGSHLVVEPFPGAPDAAIYSEAASDGRPFFVIPWNGMYLIGTTDVRYDGDPGAATISDAEVRYLVDETQRLFPEAGLADRVLYTQAGVRPLPYRPDETEGAITRRHLIHAHVAPRGLYSIIGGKLTTHRSLADQLLARLRRDGAIGTQRRRSADPLPGTADTTTRDGLLAELGQRFGQPAGRRLWNTYGGLCAELIADMARRPELGVPATRGSALLRVELVRAIETEWAVTLVDILQRRTMLGLGPDFGTAAAPQAATALTELGIWDRGRAEGELEGYRRYAARYRGLRTSSAETLRSIGPKSSFGRSPRRE